VRQLTKARIPVSSRIAKGSFSSSFAAKESKSVKEANAYQEDALNSNIEPSSDRREQNSGRKRQRSSGDGSGKGKRKK